jgi:outer membrane protein assembly factor BamB
MATTAVAGEWPSWRGESYRGVSAETGLVSEWSEETGRNLAWKVPFIGRSTPVVIDGQVCVIGRVGDGIDAQEIVACYDAKTGDQRWERRHNVYQTTVPFNRVGWASLAADPETGYIIAQGVAGQLIAFDHDGAIVWSHFLTEEFGRMSGYGGRTQTPVIDGDQVIANCVSTAWGPTAPMRHRYYSFDKRSGELLWISTPGGLPADFNTQSAPVVAVINGKRQLVAGNADGSIYGMDLFTGDKLWSFKLSKRGLNSTVLVDGNVVYASHSEENLDDPTMGRLISFKVEGEGELGSDAELWRVNEIGVGFPSPALHDGRLYVVNNSGNLFAFDAKTGQEQWQYGLGTVGKSSPVVADGKIYVAETNGRFHILAPGKDGAESLDVDELKSEGDRYAEIYGSAAIAYGRVYFATEGGLYALADENTSYSGPQGRSSGSAAAGKKTSLSPAAALRVVPRETIARPGKAIQFDAQLLDAEGRRTGRQPSSWVLQGLKGKVVATGEFVPDPKVAFQAGTIEVLSAGQKAITAVRVIGDLPWSMDFEGFEDGYTPTTWIGAARKFMVRTLEDGNKVLAKPPREVGIHRNTTYFGSSLLDNYTIEADVMGGVHKRRRPDIGLVASGYIMDLQGAHQKLEIRSWTSQMRMAQTVEFPWEMGKWYQMKMRVDTDPNRALIRGKVWPKGEPEPEAWTITVEDPHPIPAGSPGLVGFSPVDLFYDNVKVTVNP